MNIRKALSLAVVALSLFALATAVGCGEESSIQGPTSVSGKAIQSGPVGSAPEYEVRVDEIAELASSGNVRGAAKATNALFRDLGESVGSGEVSSSDAEGVIEATQTAVQDIDIDIEFGTNKKCSATFTCVKDTQMCLIVTWHVEDVGGGTNCFNF